MRRAVGLLLLLAAAAGVFWAVRLKNQPPQIPFTRAHREKLVSQLITNGKVEPMEWREVRVDKGGLLTVVPVHLGDTVTKGALLAQINEPGAAEEIRAAQARQAEAEASLQALRQGLRPVEAAQIASELERAQSSRDEARREYDSLRRLLDKQAVTKLEADAAHDKLRDAELAVQAIEKRRDATRVSAQEVAGGQARVAEAESGVRLLRERQALGAIYAPMSGVVYNLPARPGIYLNTGELVATVGNLDRLRVRVYVDEPELGRVQLGQPVKITWDGLPARAWDGAVERRPSEIIALGTRQVGEVQVTIPNPQHDLVPGTNINAEVRTNQVEDALTIPKEAMHRENGAVGVYVLQDGHVMWRQVTTGAASVTRAQILSGLQDNDAVALPNDRVLKSGDPVRPLIQ